MRTLGERRMRSYDGQSLIWKLETRSISENIILASDTER